MNHAHQSPSTLRELLHEAALQLQLASTHSARELSSRVGELQRSIDECKMVSAQAEQEIMSIYVLSTLEARPSSRRH